MGADLILSSEVQAIWSEHVLRICRFSRLARFARLTVWFRSLWLLISGFRRMVSSILWAWVLIVSVCYFFAILGMNLFLSRTSARDSAFDRIAIDRFGTVGDAMLTLFQLLTLDDVAQIYRPMILESNMPVVCAMYFFIYISTVSVVLVNLVTVIMIDGTMKQATYDKQALAAFEERWRRKLLLRVRDMLESLRKEGRRGVTWMELLDNAPDELKDDIRHLIKYDDLAEVFAVVDYDDDGSVKIDELLNGVIRGSCDDVLQKLQLSRLVKQMSKVISALFPQSRILMKERLDWGDCEHTAFL